MKRFLFLIVSLGFSAALFAQSIEVSRDVLSTKETNKFNRTASFAFNTRTGKTLVVWEKQDRSSHTIVGQLLDLSGKPVGKIKTLVASTFVAHPSVAYNEADDEYLVVFDDDPDLVFGHSDIFAQRVSPKLKKIGSPIPITTDSVSTTLTNFLPRVVYDAKHSGYVVIWIREITINVGPGTDGLVALVLNRKGQIAGNVVILQPTTVEQTSTQVSLLIPIGLDAVFHPVTGKLMVGFVQKLTDTEQKLANYFYGGVEPDLSGVSANSFSVVNSGPVDTTGSFLWGLKSVFDPTGKGFVVFVDDNKIRLRKTNEMGKVSGGAKSAFKKPKSNTKLFFPDVILTEGSDGLRALLIAAEAPFSDQGQTIVWAQVLDQNGKKVGAPVQLDKTGSSDAAQELVISVLPHPTDSTVYPFLAIYKLAGFKPPGQTPDASGLILLNLQVTIP